MPHVLVAAGGARKISLTNLLTARGAVFMRSGRDFFVSTKVHNASTGEYTGGEWPKRGNHRAPRPFALR